jgi:predicted AAA+ superfamily ATPase
MQRDVLKSLIHWKDQANRMPLLLRGARQVGKSYLVEYFGRKYFKNCIVINLELHPEYKACFSTLDPQEIVKKIRVLKKEPLQEGETLLFIDEIQECPEAIQALRYFKEKMQALHVIGAGSLLELVINQEEFRMPVGRIQSYYLKPLSFYEFLSANGHGEWVQYLQNTTLKEGVFDELHVKLLEQVKQYLLIGGMPAAVNAWITGQDYLALQEQHALILNTYRNDFGKYAKKCDLETLQLVFEKAPGLSGQAIKYTYFSREITSRTIKSALQYLRHAGVVSSVYHSNSSALPFTSGKKENKFKIIFLDCGLMQYTTHLSSEILLSKDLTLLHRGALTEQFVGQELLTQFPIFESGELYYWEREKKSSMAEVDFVSHMDSQIFPIEVKAGKTGRLKSLQVFLEEKKLPRGVRISGHSLSLERNILSIPLYMIPEMNRLLRECL